MARCAASFLLLLGVLIGLPSGLARAQEATPAAAAPATLLAVTIDRGLLPGEEGFIILGRKTFQPGAKRTYTVDGGRGSEAVIVESGELTYRIDGADGRIIRGANTASPTEEPAPAGTPFTLAAGDALIYPLQTHIEMNEGDSPVSFLFVPALEPMVPPGPDPSDVGEESTEFLAQSFGAWPDLPPGPVTLTVRADRVGAGELLPVATGGAQTVAQTTGEPGALLLADNGALNLGQEEVGVLVAELTPERVGAAPSAMPATPSAGAPPAAEILLSTTLPASALPAGPAAVELWRSTWAPGDAEMYPEYHPTISVGGDVVLSGEYAARSDGAIKAWRQGQFEDVSPGKEAVLSAGDAVIYLDNAANQWVRNAGDSTTEIASFAISLGEDYVGPNLGVDWEASGLSGKDVALTIERQTLQPGAALPPSAPDLTAPTLRIVDEGELEWVLVKPGGETTPALRFGRGAVVPFVAPVRGGQIALRNAGAEPLVLLTLTLTAAGAGAGTPTGS
jgi:hypothetical protein